MGGCIQRFKKDGVGGTVKTTSDADGQSALHVAARAGNLEAVKYFLSKGMEVNARNLEEATPLITAGLAKVNFLKIVDLLLENGADLHAVNREGNDLLFIAAWKGKSLRDLRGLISRGVNWKRTNVAGQSILHMAARGGNVEAMRFFISNGADVAARDRHQVTPLLATGSAERNFLATVDILLEHGVRINERDREGKNLIYLATCHQRPVEDLEALTKRGANWETATNDKRNSLLHIAAGHGYLEGVRYFISKGADVNDRNLKGATPLMHATLADTNFVKIVELLLSNGADVNGTDEYGDCAVFWAIRYGKCGEGLELLIGRESGDDRWNITNKVGRSLVHVTVLHGNLNALKYLVKRNAHLEQRDHDGLTPLMMAVVMDKGSTDVIDFLIENGANVSVVEQGGYGIIAVAIAIGRNVEELKHLVSRGVPMNIRNRHGSSSLHFATLKGDPDILKYFISSWNNIDERNNLGETPLLLAVKYKKHNLTAVDILVEAGADLNVVDNSWTHAALWAVEVDRSDAEVKKLVEMGCCWWTPNESGQTVFQKVTENDNCELLAYFLTLRSKSTDDFML